MSQVKENLTAIHAQIHKLCEASGRNAADVNLVAVSKKQPTDRIMAALDAGHRLFGENRVQEAKERWESIRPEYPDLRLHLIGPLQTNKVKDAVALFDVIESVDRPKLVRHLAKEMKEQGRMLSCFIQVNTGEEEQKAGILPADLPDLIALCREEGLKIAGLMCIPPQQDLPALHFAFLKKLAAEHGYQDLSMGMSSDYEKAIPLGATYIRVGTGVFGARPQDV